MGREDKTLRELVVEQTKLTGILPCIKLHDTKNYLDYAKAMVAGGAKLIEVTMTTPGALDIIQSIASELKGKVYAGAGTVLDPATAREVILHGGSFIVTPAVIPEVIKLANKYCVPIYSGAFTATECLLAMESGATMVKIFPAQLGGPRYMTNLKMVFPQVNLIPSGGINLDNAAEFIRCGACAVSGARVFMDGDQVKKEGFPWVTGQVKKFIKLVQETKKDLPILP
jgi:2-dehydro-3-deoxyphosphogluconate aldolase/(4S)-4-hydroxy-2-oxoglutarate aldolase